MTLLALLALAGYLAWWHFICFAKKRDVPYGQKPTLPVIEKFNAPIPRLLLGPQSENFAVTVPHPFKRAAVVMYAKHFARAKHRRHEIGGHAAQLERLGPLDYLPTYLWHVVFLRRSWALVVKEGAVIPPRHQVEREAVEREAALEPNPYGDVGQVP
jgi:hypothetical protein